MAALLLLCAAIGLIAWLLHAADHFRGDAVRLNLTVETSMAKLGDTFTARIAPTNAAGQPADVFNVDYIPLNGYSVAQAPDGLSAVLTAVAAGTGFVLTCTATTKHGARLTETVALPDVEADVDDEAVALGLTVG